MDKKVRYEDLRWSKFIWLAKEKLIDILEKQGELDEARELAQKLQGKREK